MAKKRERGGEDAGDKTGEYEMLRQKRIKENAERMQKLGLLDLSSKLTAKSEKIPRKASSSAAKKSKSSSLPSEPARRSSRLKTVPPVSYKEKRPEKKESFKDYEIRIEDGSEPEIYTEEHEKLLGDCKVAWKLCVDGYGEDGKRIYDSVEGKSCHQCRQKTLGNHTSCSKCNMVQGQFCGDCLYMRYGENVIEVNQNPSWICPTCRGICNCSRCRRDKGWAITGAIYRKVKRLGYKSVAHYLIQTRRGQAETKNVEILDVDESSDGSIELKAENTGEEKDAHCLDSKHGVYDIVDDDDNDEDYDDGNDHGDSEGGEDEGDDDDDGEEDE